jgi:hypothetical protein
MGTLAGTAETKLGIPWVEVGPGFGTVIRPSRFVTFINMSVKESEDDAYINVS